MTRIDAADRELIEKAFKGYGPRPDYDACVFDLRDLLTARAWRWLEYQTNEDQQRFLRECTNDPRHFRRLHWSERDAQCEWVRTRHFTDNEYAAFRQRQREMYGKMGSFMADQLYQTANRPGFMRRFFDTSTDYDVPEGTKQEFKLANRVLRHLAKPRTELRSIIRQLRNIK